MLSMTETVLIHLFHYTLYLHVMCYVMFLWGVAVLELDSHPDQNKGPEPRTLRKSQDQSP